MRDAELAAVLQGSLPFWGHLSPEEQHSVTENTYSARYDKGTQLVGSDQSCVGVLLVRHGQLRVYMLSEDGREITLYRLFPGDLCVLSAACVLEAITFEVCVSAEEETEAVIVPSAAFRQLMQKNVYAECFAYRAATERFSDVMWAMQQILFMSFDRRLAIFLVDELSKTGGDTVRMTHEQIARYIGSAREVVSRMLKYFSSEGLVELSRGGVRVPDLRRLRAVCTGPSKGRRTAGKLSQ